jgi:hypothetical protein
MTTEPDADQAADRATRAGHALAYSHGGCKHILFPDEGFRAWYQAELAAYEEQLRTGPDLAGPEPHRREHLRAEIAAVLRDLPRPCGCRRPCRCYTGKAAPLHERQADAVLDLLNRYIDALRRAADGNLQQLTQTALDCFMGNHMARINFAEGIVQRSHRALAAFDGRDVIAAGEVLEAWRVSLTAPLTIGSTGQPPR